MTFVAFPVVIVRLDKSLQRKTIAYTRVSLPLLVDGGTGGDCPK